MADREILLVEDNAELNEINRRALTVRGYRVLSAATLAEARELLRGHTPEVILLDVVLPDGSGFDFCEEIRAETDAHILYLTSKTEHADRVKGLRKGGDDYITKPYHPEEMLARVAAAMRRRDMAAAKPPPTVLTRGTLTLDTVAAQAFVGEENLLLTQKEFALLFLLVQNEGKTLSAKQLYETVWQAPLVGDKNAVQTAISKLRKKIDTTGYDLRSVRGKGYVFDKV